MSFNPGSTTIYWDLEEKQRVNLFVRTHNQYVKPFGANNEVPTTT